MKIFRVFFFCVILLFLSSNAVAYTFNYTSADSIVWLDSLGQVKLKLNNIGATGASINGKTTEQIKKRKNYEEIIRKTYEWVNDSNKYYLIDSTREVYDKNGNLLLNEVFSIYAIGVYNGDYIFRKSTYVDLARIFHESTGEWEKIAGSKYKQKLRPEQRIERTFDKNNNVLTEFIFDRDDDKYSFTDCKDYVRGDTLLSEKNFYFYDKKGRLINKDIYVYHKNKQKNRFRSYFLVHIDYYYDCDNRSVEYHYDVDSTKCYLNSIYIKNNNLETGEVLSACYIISKENFIIRSLTDKNAITSTEISYDYDYKSHVNDPWCIKLKTYNDKKKVVSDSVFNWSKHHSLCEIRVTQYTYDSSGKLLSEFYTHIDSVCINCPHKMSDWYYNFRCDENNSKTSSAHLEYKNNSLGRDLIIKVPCNDKEDFVLDSTFCWSALHPLYEKEVTQYTYNSNGTLLRKLSTRIDSSCVNCSHVISEEQFEYDASNRNTSSTHIKYSNDNEKTFSTKDSTQYDANGHILVNTLYGWDDLSKKWVVKEMTEHLSDDSIIKSYWDYAEKKLQPKEKTWEHYTADSTHYTENTCGWNEQKQAWENTLRIGYYSKHKVEINILSDTLFLDSKRANKTIHISTDKPFFVEKKDCDWIHVLTKKVNSESDVKILVDENKYHSPRYGRIWLRMALIYNQFNSGDPFIFIKIKQDGAK